MSRHGETDFDSAAGAGASLAPLASPPRLVDASDPSADVAAAALVAANRLWQADASQEARAWYALQRRRAPQRSRGAWRAGAFAFAAVALAVIAVVVLRRPSRPTSLAVRSNTLPVAPPVVAREPPPAIGGGGDVATEAPAAPSDVAAAPLPVPIRGEVVAANGVRARLSRQGVATLLPDGAGRAAIALERGHLDVDADRMTRAPADAAPIAVRASSLRIFGEGGRFRVDTDGTRVGVTVQSGAVRIYSSRRLVARVFAGQHWSFAPRAAASARVPALEPGAPGEPAPPVPAPDRDCLGHARAGATDRALACFQEQAASTGLSAEVALLEIARLRRDVSGDLAGAERALDEYRRRFPHGTLSAEAGIARVELLLRLARPSDALTEARALPEGEGDFWRAVCLAKLGRREEARGAFDGYLARPDAARRREAQRRRAELTP